MSRFFNRNLSYQGRLARGVLGSALFILGLTRANALPWIQGFLIGAGALAIFQALRGWSLVRACGFRPKH
jgi:hypothetical protein